MPWSESGLLLVAHGSARNPRANDAVRAQVERLRRRGLFADVGAAFLRDRPGPADALAALDGRAVYVVPMFMCDGRLARMAVPEALGTAHAARGGRPLIQCAPLGLAARLAAVIADRADAACWSVGLTARATHVILVGHGATADSASRRATLTQVGRVARLYRFATISFALLEEAPSLAEALAALPGDAVVVGLFVSEGCHADRDVPATLAALRAQRSSAVLYAGAIGAAPDVADVILEQVRQAAPFAAGAG